MHDFYVSYVKQQSIAWGENSISQKFFIFSRPKRHMHESFNIWLKSILADQFSLYF